MADAREPCVIISLPRPRRILGLSTRGWLIVAGVFLALIGLLVSLQQYNRAMLARDADHLFTRVLASGDLPALHRGADPRFQAAYSIEVLQFLAEQNPGLFQRGSIEVLDTTWLGHDADLYVALKARVGGALVRYVCRPTHQGGWRLVGIEPGLEAVIPRELTLLQ